MLIKALNVLLAKSKDGQSPIYPGKVVEVDDQVGREFVELEVAIEVPVSAAATALPARKGENPNGNTPITENASETPKTGIPVDEENNTMDRAYLETLSFAELKELAKSFGVYFGTMRSKESVIEALTSIRVDEELPPDLSPQDVVDE